MDRIFVNFKRFDVPRQYGGILNSDDPVGWTRQLVSQTASSGVIREAPVELVYLFPEGLLPTAVSQLLESSPDGSAGFSMGCQGVYRSDVDRDGNFGAFTTLLPAAAARTLGATWAIIGHSEERRDKQDLVMRCAGSSGASESDVRDSLNEVMNDEVRAALSRGINVLYCVGETSAERGDGPLEDQMPRIEKTLRAQIQAGLAGIESHLRDLAVVIGYEPIWAIGPGKTPPGGDYIQRVAQLIKEICTDALGADLPVVYGGGLKEANAEEIGSLSAVDGGLVALTRFTPPIGFQFTDLERIVQLFVGARGKR